MWNLPGCLPEMEPQTFDTFDEARDYIADELESVIDDIAFSPGDEGAPARIARAVEFALEQRGPFVVANICGYSYSVEEED